jgi:hypothetical protein
MGGAGDGVGMVLFGCWAGAPCGRFSNDRFSIELNQSQAAIVGRASWLRCRNGGVERWMQLRCEKLQPITAQPCFGSSVLRNVPQTCTLYPPFILVDWLNWRGMREAPNVVLGRLLMPGSNINAPPCRCRWSKIKIG